MYERFTDRARQAMRFANIERIARGKDYIWPEHLLLGLITDGGNKTIGNKTVGGIAEQHLTFDGDRKKKDPNGSNTKESQKFLAKIFHKNNLALDRLGNPTRGMKKLL